MTDTTEIAKQVANLYGGQAPGDSGGSSGGGYGGYINGESGAQDSRRYGGTGGSGGATGGGLFGEGIAQNPTVTFGNISVAGLTVQGSNKLNYTGVGALAAAVAVAYFWLNR